MWLPHVCLYRICCWVAAACGQAQWDTGGYETYRNVVSHYLRGADGVILCFDVKREVQVGECECRFNGITQREYYFEHHTNTGLEEEPLKQKLELRQTVTRAVRIFRMLAMMTFHVWQRSSRRCEPHESQQFAYEKHS